MAITPTALIERFQYALDNGYGYIYGQSGAVWTEAKQKAATRETTVKYGAKWIGHHVVDCSGLFVWAFKQLGGSIYHGSNTMYKSYCTSKGKLSNGKRTDGYALLPGTAVFTGTEGDHGHVGLFIGNGKVIEAKGTQYGVVESKVTDKKWTYWGELKGVDYDSKIPVPVGDRPTLRKGDKGAFVSTLQLALKDRGYDLGPCGVDGNFGSATDKAVRAFQTASGLQPDGIVGPKTWSALDGQITQDATYSVTIKGLTAQQAAELANKYKNVTVTEG